MTFQTAEKTLQMQFRLQVACLEVQYDEVESK